MVYDYMCNKCDNKYIRSNTIAHRKKGGRCPECTSSDTKLIMSTPAFKTCGTGHGAGWDGKGVIK
jgi:putative FmdB family regulatory protein